MLTSCAMPMTSSSCAEERPEFYLEQAKQVLDRLGLTLNAKKTRILNADEEPFDFLGHRFAVRPSKRTGKLKHVLLSVSQGDEVRQEEDSRGCPRRAALESARVVKEKINPLLRGWGNYFKMGNSRKHFVSIANYTTYITLHHAAEEAQEAVEGMEGPSAVLVLRLSRAVQAVQPLGGQ